MKLKAYVVVDTTDSYIIQEIQTQMSKFGIEFQCSPVRPQESLDHCVEYHASADCTEDQWKALPAQLNEFWTDAQDSYEDYGYNTKMFHPHVYFLSLETM